jgi:dienelactone hydrolase
MKPWMTWLVMAASMLGAVGCASMAASTEVRILSENVQYYDGEVLLEGTLAWNPDAPEPRPGVVVYHDWWGLGEQSREVARELARRGFTAFAADMYGKGLLTDDPAQAGKWAGQFRGAGAAAGRVRAQAALDVLRRDARVDGSRLGAIGFCFGGTVSLEVAWSVPDLDAAVCIHGHPTVPGAGDPARPGASLLVLHGNADAAVPETMLTGFRTAMEAAGADWEMDLHGGAVHSFTNPAADLRGSANSRYHPVASRRAMERTWRFLKERLMDGAPAR